MTTYYELLADGTIGCSTEDSILAARYGLKLITEREIVTAWNNKRYFKGEEPVKPADKDDYDRVMEEHLDAEKAERGYTKREPSDYATSTNARFRQDAEDWVAHRDEVMEYALEIENKAEAGEPVPTLEEFKSALPVITWTLEATEE